MKQAKILDLSHLKDKKLIVVGDIHGSWEQFKNLLNKCQISWGEDVVISCGDLADRGPQSDVVLTWFIEYGKIKEAYCVQGNHDNKLMRLLNGSNVSLSNGLKKTLDQINGWSQEQKDELRDYLNSLPHIIKLPDVNGKPAYCVHAGFAPGISPENQSAESCIYTRGINPKNYFDESGGIWYEFLNGDYYVFSGHIKEKNPRPNEWSFCLDGGCVHGGVLRAAIIENGKVEIVEVDGWKPGKITEIPEGFKLVKNEHRQKLITPELGVGNSSWKSKESLWMRSLLINIDDNVISVGFPKFFNLEEGPNEFKITEEDLLNRKDLVATLKIDGSLLIRYVQDGKVKWRTRGSLEVGLDNKDEIDVFIERYPKLADPNYYHNASLLFEWVSPRNQIVIKYDAPAIYLIGGVIFERGTEWYNNEFALLTMKHLEKISTETGICCTIHFDLKNQADIVNLVDKLKTDKEIEGYVIRFDNEQRLVKLKTDQYFILHSLKSNLNTASLIDLYLAWDLGFNKESFKDKFIKSYDWETWQIAEPAVSSMFDGIWVAARITEHINKFVNDNRTLPRKDFAILAKSIYEGEKLSACFSLLDNKPINNKIYKTWILQNCKMYEFSMFKKDRNNDMES